MNKIGLYEFNVLTEDQKAQMVWDFGTFITNKADGKKAVTLYSLSNFYVEIWYNQTENQINNIRSFSSIKQLSPYLDDMDVDLS